jgi:hypothetical protein
MPRRRFASPSRPTRAIPNGHTFTITVNYTGAPGVHHDGDGSEEGWFRAADGNWMATEPVGSKDWMPLNDYPGAKPTYYFSLRHGLLYGGHGDAVRAALLLNHSAACRTRLSQFFKQWLDTAYHGAKPQITGPGLHGHPFYAHGCTAPSRRVSR